MLESTAQMSPESGTRESSPDASTLIRSLLHSRELSQEDGARLAGIRIGMLSAIVRGRTLLSSEVAEKIATGWQLSKEEYSALKALAVEPGRARRRRRAGEKKSSALVAFGQFLREQREGIYMTATEVAELCSMKPPNWVKIEKGRMLPNPAKLARIATVLEMSPEVRVELAKSFAAAFAKHSRFGKATTVPALVALVELVLLNRDLGQADQVQIYPHASELADPKAALSALQSALAATLKEVIASTNSDPSSVTIRGAVMRHEGRTSIFLPIVISL
jgi:transcriptional regulator with XRE-family HTH domain